MVLTKKQHIQRHELLRAYLDELVADFITHTEKLPSKTTIFELLQWSHLQTIVPKEDVAGSAGKTGPRPVKKIKKEKA